MAALLDCYHRHLFEGSGLTKKTACGYIDQVRALIVSRERPDGLDWRAYPPVTSRGSCWKDDG